MSKRAIIINKIITWKLTILAGLIPLFFLPFTSEFYDFNKNILLFYSVLVLLILWAFKIIFSKELRFKRSIFDLPILAIAGAFILSTIFASPNRLETLWLPEGTGTIVTLTIIYFIITNNLRKADQAKILKGFLAGSVILSLIAIYQFIGLGETFINENSSLAFLRLKSWTPAGNLLHASIFLLIILILVFIQSTSLFKKIKNGKEKILSSIHQPLFIVIIIAGLTILLLQLFSPENRPLLLPLSTAWAIAIESLKNGRNFFLGVGPKSFLDAFSQFRPSNYSLTSLWATRFALSRNFYLHLLTTVGLLGLAAWIWLIGQVIKKKGSLLYFLPLLVIFLLFLFLPANFLVFSVLYILLGLMAINSPSNEYKEKSKTLAIIIFSLTIIITATCGYFVTRAYAAEIYFKRSLNDIAQNDGTKAYNNQIKAITLNPYNDAYRLSYSQVNLSLADTLAGKANISDQDRQNITTLVQQAIREAKVAVSLNKNKVTNWENLGQIYRQLINFAEGADQWAITTLRQHIDLDPTNPQLKLRLGGIYYALGDYDEAIRWFQKAVDDKVNFANGYYNLSAAYREKGDFKKAHEIMQTAVNLVPSDSPDYQKARNELEELAKKIPPQETKPEEEVEESEILSEPEIPEVIITPPIELPKESGL